MQNTCNICFLSLFTVALKITVNLNLAKSDMAVIVNQYFCNMSFNLDTVGNLKLSYYGADLETVSFAEEKYCLVNITSQNESAEICVEDLNLHTSDISAELVCSLIFRYYVRHFNAHYIPSTYRCRDFEPLCVAEKKVFAQFTHKKTFKLLGTIVKIDLKFYLRVKELTTVASTHQPYHPDTTDEGTVEDEEMSTWIIVLISIGSMGIFVCCLLFCCARCCRNKSENSQTQQDRENNTDMMLSHSPLTGDNQRGVGDQSRQDFPETTPTNLAVPPPDYDTVMATQPVPDTSSKYDGLEKDIAEPSAPPPPYPGIM